MSGAPAGADAALPGDAAHEDHTGRHRMAWNILTSWAGHVVFVIAGFLLPRLMDRTVGQEMLGLWDFAWSLVSYFGLAEIGGGSSLSRYVARYRAAGDVASLRSAASSVMLIQTAVGGICLAATLVVGALLPVLFGDRIAVHLAVARPVVLLLGASLALELGCDTFHGVITGCHRWDLHNWVNAGSHAVATAGMVAALLAGGGLRSIALVYFAAVLGRELVRRHLAYRVCPELELSVRHASRAQVREMVTFGGKATVHGIARVVLFQGNSVLVASHLGPAALALYARPQALLRHAEAFVNKFAHVLTPTASSLQARGRADDLRRLLVESTRFGLCLCLPLLLLLAVMGGPILTLWMGPRYEQGHLLALFAAGYVAVLSQRPALTILIGLNAHGRLGVASLVGSVLGVALSWLLVGVWDFGLAGAAVAVALALFLGGGAYVFFRACDELALSPVEYLRRAYLPPVLCALPYVGCLAAARRLFPDHPLYALLAGGGAGAAVIVPLYWLYVLPVSARAKVEDALRAAYSRGSK